MIYEYSAARRPSTALLADDHRGRVGLAFLLQHAFRSLSPLRRLQRREIGNILWLVGAVMLVIGLFALSPTSSAESTRWSGGRRSSARGVKTTSCREPRPRASAWLLRRSRRCLPGELGFLTLTCASVLSPGSVREGAAVRARRSGTRSRRRPRATATPRRSTVRGSADKPARTSGRPLPVQPNDQQRVLEQDGFEFA